MTRDVPCASRRYRLIDRRETRTDRIKRGTGGFSANSFLLLLIFDDRQMMFPSARQASRLSHQRSLRDARRGICDTRVGSLGIVGREIGGICYNYRQTRAEVRRDETRVTGERRRNDRTHPTSSSLSSLSLLCFRYSRQYRGLFDLPEVDTPPRFLSSFFTIRCKATRARATW